MWLLYILIGTIIGFLLAWYLLGRQHVESLDESEKHWQGRLDAANNELRSAAEDNQEIKDRLIGLQEEHQLCEGRIGTAEERAADSERRGQEAALKASEAVEAKSVLSRELDQSKTALAHERARSANLLADVERFEHSAGADPGGRSQSRGKASSAEPVSGGASSAKSFSDDVSPSFSIHEDAATYETKSSEDASSEPLNAKDGRRKLRKLDQKIAQLPAGSKARLALERDRDALIASSDGELSKSALIRDIPRPSMALHEARTEFRDSGTAPPAALSALSAGALEKRGRLQAIESKIAQLPAGSSARRKLEMQRAQMAGDDGASPADMAVAAASPAKVETSDPGEDSIVALFETPAGVPDNLKRIKGVGKVLEKKLNKLGITQFAQVAAFGPDDITRVDDVLDFKGRIDREDWVGQAKKLARG